MSELCELSDDALKGLKPEAVAALAQQLLERVRQQARQIEQRDQAIKFKDAKIEKITFELARFKRWKFGAKAEAMTAEQRRLFEQTCAEDEAHLQAQLNALQASQAESAPVQPKGQPRREKLPEHLRRLEHRHEPEDTTCPTPGCAQPMQRVGEDVSEKLDVVPAEFFVHRHIYGKWACRCCQTLVQEPSEPSIIEGGIPASGLLAHTLISRFVDHLPYYRQESINARSGVHTPRSSLAQWAGQAGAALEPLYEAHKAFVLSCGVLHADETPVALLDPGTGKTKRAYVWGYARGAFDVTPAVVYDFCLGRGAQYPLAFLAGDERAPWTGTLVRDEYAVYDSVLKAVPGRMAAGCLAHARRKFEELLRNTGKSAVATQALMQIGAIYGIEREIATLSVQDRLQERQRRTQPLWDQWHKWLLLERQRVPDGSATAKALDYSINSWQALTRHLLDGQVNVDNNSLENLLRPWAMGRKAWLFVGSQLAGQRAAVVMSLVHSAKLNGHDPYVWLRDVLTRLPTHLNSRIEELLPYRWQSVP